jgi:hypothetical protein
MEMGRRRRVRAAGTRPWRTMPNVTGFVYAYRHPEESRSYWAIFFAGQMSKGDAESPEVFV